MINVLACYAFIFSLDNLFKITDFGGEEKGTVFSKQKLPDIYTFYPFC